MRGKVTFILLGILIILSVYVYLVEIKGKVQKDQAEERAKRIFTLKESDVRKINIQRSGEMLIFEINEDGWQLLSPVKARGYQSSVNSLVTNVVQLKIEREIKEDINWSDYGLASPQFTVVLESVMGQIDTLFLGNENPTGNYLFARKQGESRVLLIGSNIQSTLTREIFDLRDKTMLPFERNQVRQLTLNRKGEEEIVIEKEGDDWKIVKPFSAFGNTLIINGMIDQMKSAQVKSFEDEEPQNLSRYGLNPPDYDVTLTVGIEHSQKRFLVGKEKETNRYYAMDVARLPVFTIDNLLVDKLKYSLSELRDKYIVRLDRQEIFTIEFFSDGKLYFDCQKVRDLAWQSAFPQEAKLKKWRVDSFFSFLVAVEVEKFIEQNSSNLSQYGLLAPQTEVTLKDSTGEVIVHLAIGKKVEDNMVYVLDKVSNWIYVATDNLINNFNPNIDEYIESRGIEQMEGNTSL